MNTVRLAEHLDAIVSREFVQAFASGEASRAASQHDHHHGAAPTLELTVVLDSIPTAIAYKVCDDGLLYAHAALPFQRFTSVGELGLAIQRLHRAFASLETPVEPKD